MRRSRTTTLLHSRRSHISAVQRQTTKDRHNRNPVHKIKLPSAPARPAQSHSPDLVSPPPFSHQCQPTRPAISYSVPGYLPANLPIPPKTPKIQLLLAPGLAALALKRKRLMAN